MTEKRIAMVGAGMAGLTCARQLAGAGASVTVFDKSGDIGGRLASRRRQGIRWNHGAPGVAARNPAFMGLLDGLVAEGSAERLAAGPEGVEYRGVPDMRELLRPVAAPLDIRCGSAVQRLELRGRGRGRAWWLGLEDSPDTLAGPFDVVLTSQPAPQAVALLSRSGIAVPARLRAVTMTPCWALLIGFAEPAEPLVACRTGSTIVRLDRQPRFEPPEPGEIADAWVAHAGIAWTRRHLELDRAEAAQRLLAELGSQCGAALPAPSYLAAHRWRYARTGSALGSSHVWLVDEGLGLAGDWCLGADAESAFMSGRELARAVSAA